MIRKVFLTLGLLALVLLTPMAAAAASLPGRDVVLSPQTINPQATNPVSVTFAELGYADSELAGPFDQTRRIFSVPINWQMEPGGVVVLDYDVLLTGADASLFQNNTYLGTLTVSFNNKILDTIRLNAQGTQTSRLLILPQAVTSIRENGQHELTLTLNALFDCLYKVRTVVVVKSTSYLEMPFAIGSPELSLARLPAPFYLRNSLLPERTLVVTPDNPSVEELRAAMNVMAGFGSMVQRPFDFHLVSLSRLSEADKASSHLIFVGRPNTLPLLKEVSFPAPVVDGKFADLPESSTDGVVEMAYSPWNPNKVVMLVGGYSGDALLKAAQAVGSGKIFTAQNPSLVYVSDVRLFTENAPAVEDFTLESLGYKTETISTIGIDQIDYTFFVAKEQIASDGVLNLVYYHSGLMDYGVSSLSVLINDQLIAGKPFSEESEQVTRISIKIPPKVLRFGENQLRISARMQPDLACDFSGFSKPWLVVSNQTSLHLPATTQTIASVPLLDLKNYPTMFMTDGNLSDVTFVLPKGDALSWSAAAELAYGLGENAVPSLPNLGVAYADDVPEKIRSTSSLIFIGKPSTLPMLKDVNAALPAPFDFETNLASTQNLRIVYRLPADVHIGYLELAASPFAPGKLLMVLAGNTEEGVGLAVSALTKDVVKDKLAGLFALTNGTEVLAGDGITYALGSVAPSAGIGAVNPLPATPSVPQRLPPPPWLLPTLIVSSVIVVLLMLYFFITSFQRRQLTAAVDVEEGSDEG